MNPWGIPAMSSVTSCTASYVIRVRTKWRIELDATSLEVKPPSIAVHYAYSTWESMDSVWKKFSPRQNDSNQAIVHDSSGLPYEMFLQVRDYEPPHSADLPVLVGV